MKKISFNHIRWILVTIFIVYIASFAYIYVFKFEVKEKGLQYLEPIEIVELLKFNSEQIANLREGKFILYKAKVADLYKNITISLFICLLGALVLSRKEDIEFPGFPSLKIPISITYIIVPGALCYYWLQFGFLLHRIISTRIGLTRLIDAEYMIINKIDKEVTIPYKNYYTVTHSNNLMDVGFIDSWFVTFLPEHFKTAPMFGFDNFVITGTMITVGILYGISHGFSLGLPLNWIRRYSNSKR